ALYPAARPPRYRPAQHRPVLLRPASARRLRRHFLRRQPLSSFVLPFILPFSMFAVRYESTDLIFKVTRRPARNVYSSRGDFFKALKKWMLYSAPSKLWLQYALSPAINITLLRSFCHSD